MAKTFCIEISKRDLEDAVGMDLDDHDCEMIVDRLEPMMGSYAMEELIRDAAQQVGILDDEDDREDNPSKHRPKFPTSSYHNGLIEKRISTSHLTKVYPSLRAKIAGMKPSQRREVMNELWSFISASIEEDPALQQAGWEVGTEPSGGDFAVYYRSLVEGLSFEDIIAHEATLAVEEVAGGEYERRKHNPASGLPLGSIALGAAVGAAAMHFKMKPKQ